MYSTRWKLGPEFEWVDVPIGRGGVTLKASRFPYIPLGPERLKVMPVYMFLVNEPPTVTGMIRTV